jgi:hypothetical protein
MLTGIHFLLTYTCNYECDHCFVYCSPRAEGTFTMKQIRKVLEEGRRIGTVDWIYYEGGEPMLYYPVLVVALKAARDMGFKTGVVSNGYFATCEEDAELWLRPLVDVGIADISISDDTFHGGEEQREDTSAKRALAAARKVGAPVASICIEEPTVETGGNSRSGKGAPVVGGGALFKGRAAEKLTPGLPRRGFKELRECPHEELEKPERVHVDSLGNVHLCQGVSMGNMWKTPLSALVKGYDPQAHPICGPLLKGGPALLAAEYGVEHEDHYVDECHMCFLVRRALMERFPEYLTPPQVYGFEEE